MAPPSMPRDLSVEDIWHHQSYAGYLALNAAVVFGIVLWDYIQLLPEERSLYDHVRGPEWHSPAPWAFILLRYSAIVSAVSGILYSSVRIHDCQLALSIGQAASVIVVASSGVLFCCRVGSLWDYQRIPLAVSVIPCFIMTSAWVSVATQYKVGVPEFDLPFGTNCRLGHLPGWTPVGYAVSAVFNCIIFGMVMTRIVTKCTMVATNTGWTLINRACIIYLLFSVASSIVVLIVYSIDMPDDLLKRASTPYLILILMAMGSRIFLNLRLHDNIIRRVEESNHFTARNWTPGDSEKSSGIQTSSHAHEPSFDAALTVLSVPASEVRSLGTYTTRTTLTVPDTPATATSFTESAYGTPHSTRSLATPFGNIPSTKSPHVDSVRSFATASTRQKDTVPEMPEIPKRVRVGSVKSISSTSTGQTGGPVPPSPKRKPVPSMKSFETTSTNLTKSSPPKPRRERTDSFRYFATTSTLNTDELKSTWHGI
ncbi:hypothetical protein BDZ97DRAFT_1798778 [Flammula alnicola]|nr:hypothetical protein BDZ97DRAFT_1798778 [Flammula alnicola]